MQANTIKASAAFLKVDVLLAGNKGKHMNMTEFD